MDLMLTPQFNVCHKLFIDDFVKYKDNFEEIRRKKKKLKRRS